MTALSTADCYPLTAAPGLSRLFMDFCADGSAGYTPIHRFYSALPHDESWYKDASLPAAPKHRAEILRLLAAQNPSAAAAQSLFALGQGAGIVATGQQVGLFGGQMLSALKAATALGRARQAAASGKPHVAVFWLATEDHDFAEINHVVFPGRRELRKLTYTSVPRTPQPVGGIVLGESIDPLIDEVGQLFGPSDVLDILVDAYKPGRTFAQAFGELYARIFAAQGLLMLDASSPEFHRLGAPVLRAALEQADELHSALLDRNRELLAAGYHAQVAVTDQSSLLFLLDERTGARVALKRMAPSASEPGGLWQAGRQNYSTADLIGVLESQPERISPSALLRPVFQDYLLSTAAIVGGPAEIAYFAQSAMLYERILGRATPALPRLSATMVEPATRELLRKYDLTPDAIFGESPNSLAQKLANEAMPIEGRRKLAATGVALDQELATLLDWMRGQDAGLGRSAETAASKMRYQMNRLRRLAANFELQREASLARDAQALCHALFPDGALQERTMGAAYFFARYGLNLAAELVARAEEDCRGHIALWL